MILKAKERGDGKQLGLYLLRDANEHVEVRELRGFASDDLPSALQEIDAISRGTRAKNCLFSMSLNPPARERVGAGDYEKAIDAIEQRLGLEGQPRAIVFHEKDGRRHAHAVWSRIDADRMRAINLPHFKLKLKSISRELYIEHGWQMPRGLMNSKERDPKNYTRAEWEQAKRAGRDVKALKAMFQECWSASDSKKAFVQALSSRGYALVRGERGHLAMDFQGEVFAISKWVGLRAKEVRARLGEAASLPTVEQARKAVASRMTDKLRDYIAETETTYRKKTESLTAQNRHVIERQRKERAALEAAHQKRWTLETAERATRLSKGFRGLWDRLTGTYGKQARENEREAWDAMKRDAREKDRLIERHLDERESFHTLAKQVRAAHEKDVAGLHRDIASYLRMSEAERPDIGEHFGKAREPKTRGPGRRKDRGPEHEH